MTTTKKKFRPSDERFVPYTVGDEELTAGRKVIYTDAEGKQHKGEITCVHRDNVHVVISADKTKAIHSKVVFADEQIKGEDGKLRFPANTFQLE